MNSRLRVLKTRQILSQHGLFREQDFHLPSVSPWLARVFSFLCSPCGPSWLQPVHHPQITQEKGRSLWGSGGAWDVLRAPPAVHTEGRPAIGCSSVTGSLQPPGPTTCGPVLSCPVLDPLELHFSTTILFDPIALLATLGKMVGRYCYIVASLLLSN